jgi:hypothetical protein
MSMMSVFSSLALWTPPASKAILCAIGKSQAILVDSASVSPDAAD